MTFEEITSRENSLLKHARKVRDGKVDESIFVEGLRLCEEALESNLNIEAVIVSDELANKPRAKQLLGRFKELGTRISLISESLLGSISYTKTPQGIVLLATRPTMNEATFKARQSSSPLVVVMHGVNNPVNVGAILRTAEAAGVTGVITTQITSDPFLPKSLRGSMGSAFRLPVWAKATYAEVINWCQPNQIKIVCTDVGGKTHYSDVDWKGPSALVMGPESAGLDEEDFYSADVVVHIPMQGSVESLNVAAAAAVVLFEAARQRRS
jgi:TrmH family RNA methyltransferase